MTHVEKHEARVEQKSGGLEDKEQHETGWADGVVRQQLVVHIDKSTSDIAFHLFLNV